MSVTFLITSLVIVALPGTGALLTVSAALTYGARASVVTAVGCTLGILPHLAAAITGTAALLWATGIAFDTVKELGIVYLLYMAWSTWRDTTPLQLDAPARRSPLRVIGSSILANLLNPKLTSFFFAFLPQFIPQHSSHQSSSSATGRLRQPSVATSSIVRASSGTSARALLCRS